MENNKIVFTEEDGSEITFFIVDETKVNGINYILVTDAEDADLDEAEAYIMKDVSADADTDAIYEFVEDEAEFDAVADIFGEIVDEDTDLVK